MTDDRRDEVDRIVASWSQQRPDLDVSPLQVLSRITRVSRSLEGIRRDAFREHGLEAWEFDVLAALRRTGPPFTLSPGRLIEATGVTSGTMTNRLDRLTERGLVERNRGRQDRRAIDVQLTPSGRLTVDAALAGLVAAESAILGRMSPADQDRLANLLGDLMELMPE